MKIPAKTAAMSHLSDAQELLRMGLADECDLRINFAKRIICKYPSGAEVDEEELDELWADTLRRFGNVK